MTEQEKSPIQQTVIVQDPQQIQILLKETLKENKSLQSKNSKLQSKYVELFKENKLLKQDRTILVSFALSLFTDAEGNQLLQEPAMGQCNQQELDSLKENKDNSTKLKIKELQDKIAKMNEQQQHQLQKQLKLLTQKLNSEWQTKAKNKKEQQTKEFHTLQRQIEYLKKINEQRVNEINDIKSILETRSQELSKISKEKLKMEHHLNNIRIKEISKELTPPKEPDQSKTLVDKNQYLSLKHQVETLMAKRDQLKKNCQKLELQLTAQKKMTEDLQKQLERLSSIQRECDEKYELVRQCSLEDLENMIISYHIEQPKEKALTSNSKTEEVQKQKDHTSNEEQVKREYLKNMVIRYIKAQISGKVEQALTLLEIISRIVQLDHEAVQSLNQYISKHKQWWYIKY